MNKLPLIGCFAAVALFLTGCDSVTIVETRPSYRSTGYYGGSYGYYGRRDYDNRYYASSYNRSRYYGNSYSSSGYYRRPSSSTVVVANRYKGDNRDVYVNRSTTYSHGRAYTKTNVLVLDQDKKKKKKHHD